MELGAEQQYIDSAYHYLDKGLADAERSMSEFRPQHRSTAQAIQRALKILKESRGTGQLVFGRMRDGEDDLYIGRRRVHDDDRDPVVVSWHAPAATRFYEASPSDPLGLELKRNFTEQDRRLVRIIDEIVAATAADASDVSGLGAAVSDALLEELDRSRDGAMRDVVATIQAEQFDIIRSPLDRVVVVAGGPGTGKTVVGLHRAAWLAFNHENLRRDGILVVTPSTSFLTYVSGVLPSLDVTDVDQVELQRLYAGEADLNGEDDQEGSRVKGSAAMAQVLRNALEGRIGWSGGDLEVALGADRLRLGGDEVQQIVADVRARSLLHNDARDVFRDALARALVTLHREQQQEQGRPARANEATIRRLSAFVNAIDRIWPSFTPEELLRSLYGTQTWLTRAAEGVLTTDERARLYRAPADTLTDEPWTEADLYCLDEISALLSDDTVTYGHLVVDEAQDLSPMQARALQRRCPSGSMTVLGDLAQSTGHWVRDDWTELTDHLAMTPGEVKTLSIGYRVPADVLALAARQLSLADPRLTPPRSIRTGLGAPEIRRCDLGSLPEELASRVSTELAEGRTTAVLTADKRYAEVLHTLQSSDIIAGDGRDGDFSKDLTVVPRSGAKGLEFDSVILVEPAEIAIESLQPERALYVAMTRCTQSLQILHEHDLPRGFIDADLTPSPDLVEQAADDGLTASPVGGAAGPSAATVDEPLDDLVRRLSTADRNLVHDLVVRLLDLGDDSTA